MSRLAEVSLILGIGLAVLAFGGTEPGSFAVVEVLLLGTAAWLLANFGSVLAPAGWSKGLLVPTAIVGVIVVQLCPLPVGFLERITARENPGTGVPLIPLSTEPYSTRTHLLIVLTCLVAFYLARVVSQDRKRQQRLIFSLIALGCFEAFYGLLQYLTGWQQIFTYAKKYDLAEATGTYINRNHYAGLLEMILPLSLALAFYEYGNFAQNQRQPRPDLRKLVTRVSFQRLVLWFSVAIVLFAALLFSRSRMGIVAGCASLVVVVALAGVSRFRVRMLVPLTAGFLVISICLALWIGAGPVAERFQSVGDEYSVGAQSRVSIWRDDLRLVGQHPWLGTGLGTFPNAYTRVQTAFLGQFVNHAHNDYLEIASDLGLPAAVALFASIFLVLVGAVRTFLRAEGNFGPTVALGCTGSIVAMLLHALADFNLYIPANALVFSTILGLARPAPCCWQDRSPKSAR
jgi:O-antigen ligase